MLIWKESIWVGTWKSFQVGYGSARDVKQKRMCAGIWFYQLVEQNKMKRAERNKVAFCLTRPQQNKFLKVLSGGRICSEYNSSIIPILESFCKYLSSITDFYRVWYLILQDMHFFRICCLNLIAGLTLEFYSTADSQIYCCVWKERMEWRMNVLKIAGKIRIERKNVKMKE